MVVAGWENRCRSLFQRLISSSMLERRGKNSRIAGLFMEYNTMEGMREWSADFEFSLISAFTYFSFS